MPAPGSPRPCRARKPRSTGRSRSACATTANFGVELIEISIAEAMKAYGQALDQSFEGTEPGIAEENLQARIRGNLVMALSNKFGWLVLTTGNKSELSVGYATLYGDMAGGLAVAQGIRRGGSRRDRARPARASRGGGRAGDPDGRSS